MRLNTWEIEGEKKAILKFFNLEIEIRRFELVIIINIINIMSSIHLSISATVKY